MSPLESKFTGRPIQIYLDSADFSNLADEKGDRLASARRLDVFARAKEARIVEFRFSGAIVAEAAPLQLEHLKAGTDRIRLVANLCNRLCLRATPDVMRRELLKTSGGTADPIAWSDVGDWVPHVDLSEELVRARSDLEHQISRLPRGFRSRFYDRDSSRLKNLRSLSHGDASSLSALLEKYPVSENVLPILFGFLERRGTAKSVERRFFDGFSDLNRVARLFEANFERATGLMTWVRQGGSQHVARMQNLKISLVQASVDSKSRAQVLSEQVFAQLARYLPGGDGPAQGWLEPEDKYISFESIDDLIRNAPTVCTMIWSIAEMMNRGTADKFAVRPKASDMGDLFHALYIPYVDVFRCDKAMAETFKPAGKVYGTWICDSLECLVTRLESMLSNPAG
jgi:hypothetical protein